MRNKWLIGYLIFVHLFLGLVLVKSDFIFRVGYRVGLIRPVIPEITQHFKRMLIHHERMDGNVPDGAVVFIGDSITQGLCVSAVITPSVNYGIGMDTTVGVLERLPKYHSLVRASVGVLAVGVNDLQRRENEEILKNYFSILKTVPAELPLVISAVLPLDEPDRGEAVGKNRRIRALNAGLKTLCETQRTKCIFLDSGLKLADSSGNLSKEFHEENDGLHLNGAGYAIWIQDLKEAIEQAQKLIGVGQ